ncbi:MAG: molecular chaperone DnaJ, partial [Treponemataceae bacterium]|nr:molecular chaperone DnaJ [Treponemataceae bacterium]
IALAQDVFKKHISGVISDELAIDVFERALELNLGQKSDAFYLARIAESYMRLGDRDTSQICAQKARELDPAVYIAI